MTTAETARPEITASLLPLAVAEAWPMSCAHGHPGALPNDATQPPRPAEPPIRCAVPQALPHHSGTLRRASGPSRGAPQRPSIAGPKGALDLPSPYAHLSTLD